MKKLILPILAALLLTGLCSAAIIESGDGGAAFAENTSLAKCKEANVAAVYICSGNTVQVVSSLPGAGSTFYKPDGRVIECPVVELSKRTGECVQLTNPNLCKNESVCKETGSEEVNVTEPSAPEQPTEPEKTPPETNVSQPLRQNQTQPQVQDNTTVVKIIPEKKIDAPGQQDMLVLGILVIGMIVIALLNYMYTKSKGSEQQM